MQGAAVAQVGLEQTRLGEILPRQGLFLVLLPAGLVEHVAQKRHG